MVTNDSCNDEVLFDRLVDGELTGDDRRRLLESLDSRPDGWRRCALAFLEAQSWRAEMGQIARAPQPVSVSDSNKTVSGRGTVPFCSEDSAKPGQSPTVLLEPLSEPTVARAPAAATSRPPIWKDSVTWLAMAAMVLFAFGLGWMQHGRGVPSAGTGGDPSTQIAKDAGPAAPAPNAVKPGEAITFYVNDESGRKQPVRVPLVDADTLNRQFGLQFQPGMSNDMRNQLQNRGFTVQSKQRYAPLWLENGQPMVVPVEDTKIVPVSNRPM